MKSESINWCTEDEAVKILGYKKSSLRVFTRDSKRKKLPIRTSKINRTTFLYSMQDIKKFIEQKATA